MKAIHPAQRPPCAYPPDCPYAGGPGTCPFANGRTPAEMYDLWHGCFGQAIAGRLLAEWIAEVERDAAQVKRHAGCTIDHYGGYVVAESVLPHDQSLIAAAPDLLAAAEHALYVIREFGVDAPIERNAIAQLKAAIAKANGTPPAAVEVVA